MKRLAPIIAAVLAAPSCGGPAVDNGSVVANDRQARGAAAAPTFQLPVIPGRPGAAYFSIEVSPDQGALIGVTSPQAGRIEMHDTMRQGAMSGMRPIERIEPEQGRIVLERGGRHLMLFEVNPSLAEGGRAQLVLRFEHGRTRTLDARIVTPGGAHEGH